MILFEAARWAPSSYNSQPWRFLYARRGTAHWDKFLGLLNAFNQSWAKDASVLIILVSNSVMLPPGADKAVPSHSHSLDAGAAWENLALQARSRAGTHMAWSGSTSSVRSPNSTCRRLPGGAGDRRRPQGGQVQAARRIAGPARCPAIG